MAEQEWSFCSENEQIAKIYFNYVLPPLDLASSVCVLFLMYQLWRMKIIFKEKWIFWLNLSLFVCCSTQLFCQGMYCIFRCYDHDLHRIFYSIAGQFYVAGYFCLIALLYARLYKIFKDTLHAISGRGHIIFGALYGVAIIDGTFAAFFYVHSSQALLTVALTTLFLVMTIVLIITLVLLFIRKLFAVYKTAGHDEDITVSITKSSLLAIISLAVSFVSFTSTILAVVAHSVHLEFILVLITLTDSLCNAIVIFLSYSPATASYDVVCGKCHKQWHMLWSQCANVDINASRVSDQALPDNL